MYEDFAGWDMQDLCGRVELVQDFDRTCDRLREGFIFMLERYAPGEYTEVKEIPPASWSQQARACWPDGRRKMMHTTPQILVRNFERCSRVLCTESGTLDNLNMSTIATRLIQDVGRFCERYASDFLISWDAVRKQLEPRHITEPCHAVELFALRRSGVDHNSFFMSRLRNDSRGPGRSRSLMQPKPLQILRKRNILLVTELAVTGSKGRYQNEQSGTVHICNQQHGGMAAAECFGDAASCERHDG
jgi:hypothetical protein